ncbi:MAG TPA: MFS transporter [Burkholderiales bacterium]|nr:MFS transporter [Burkholderiales bacterium]
MTGKTTRKGAWTVTVLLFFFMMINFADKGIVGLAGVPIMNELHLTPQQFGLIGSSFFLLFSVSAVVTGFLADRIASKWLLLAMGLIWALAQFPMAGAVGLGTLMACRVALGAGEGPAYPVALHAVYKWFPDDKRPLPGAVIAQGSAIGGIVSFPALNWVITHHSWHMAFAALGVAGLIWAAVWALLGREGTIGDLRATPGAEAAEGRIAYRHLLLNGTNIASWCAYFGAYFGLALALTWFTPYLISALGFSQEAAGELTAVALIAGVFVILGGSWLSQRLMHRGASSRIARGMFSGIAICAGGVALMFLPHVAAVAAKVALATLGVALPSIVFTLSPAILAEITPSSQRGAILAINSAVGTSAGVIAPYVMGSVIQGAASAAAGYSEGFLICGMVMIVGGLIGLAFLRPESQRARYSALRDLISPQASAS